MHKEQKLNRLLETPITRKKFLSTVGIGLISLFGFASLSGLLSKNETRNKLPDYGMQNYGP